MAYPQPLLLTNHIFWSPVLAGIVNPGRNNNWERVETKDWANDLFGSSPGTRNTKSVTSRFSDGLEPSVEGGGWEIRLGPEERSIARRGPSKKRILW